MYKGIRKYLLFKRSVRMEWFQSENQSYQLSFFIYFFPTMALICCCIVTDCCFTFCHDVMVILWHHLVSVSKYVEGHFLFQIEIDEDDVDDRFRGLFGQLAGSVSVCWWSYFLSECRVSQQNWQKLCVCVCCRTVRSRPSSCRKSSTKWWPNVRITWCSDMMLWASVQLKLFVSDRIWHQDQRL